MEKKKVFRFCVGEGTNPGQAKACTFDKFNELTDSERVRTICSQIASLMEGYWGLSEEEQRKRDEEKSKLKKKLPFITVHSQFFDDDEKYECHRSNETAHDNGVVMLDIDHVENPRAYWESLTEEQIKEHGIFFACITPSTYGLHVLADRREGENIKQAQYRLGYLFGLKPEDKNETRFDKHTHDASRAAYLTPRDYILCIKDEKMCFQSEEEAQEAESRKYDVKPRTTWNSGSPLMTINKRLIAEGDCTPLKPYKEPLKGGNDKQNQPLSTTNQPINASTDEPNQPINASTDEPVYTVHGVDIPYSSIVWALAKEIEKEEGAIQAGVNRHNYHIAWCNYLRYICENNPEKLVRIVPNLMEEDDPEGNDLRRAAEDMCAYAPWKKMPKQLKAAIQSVQDKMQPEVKPFSPVEDLPIPRLPRLLELATSHLSDPEYVAATIILALPVLGAEATGCRFRYYYNGKVQTFAFTNMVVAGSGMGKSTPFDIAEILATPMAQQSEIAVQQENEYREDIRTASSSERKKKNPNISNRFFCGSITEAALLAELQKSRSKHLLVMTDELDTLCGEDASLKPGNGIWQKMYDNHRFGKYCKSIDASNGAADVLCNIVSATQTLLIGDFFSLRDVIKGAALRCGFAYLSHEHEEEMDPFTPEEEAEMIATAQALMTIPQGYMMTQDKYGWLDNAVREWRADKKSDYEVGEIDEAGRKIMKRIPLIMQRAGYLYSLLYAPELANAKTDEEREQIKQDCINLMLWTGEYIYRVQYFLFADDLLKEHEMEVNRNNASHERQVRLATAKIQCPPILRQLPDTFTEADFIQAAGIDANDNNALAKVRNKLCYYQGKQRATRIYIRKNGDGTYSKII